MYLRKSHVHFLLVIDLAPYTSEQFRRVPKHGGKYSQPEKHHTGIHHGEESDNNQVHIKDVRLDSLVGILVSGLVPIEKIVPCRFQRCCKQQLPAAKYDWNRKDSRGRTVNKYSQSTK